MGTNLDSLTTFGFAPITAAIEDDIKKISRPVRLALALGLPALLWGGMFFVAAQF